MKLYRVIYGTTQDGRDVVRSKWVGTQAAAAAVKKKLNEGIEFDIEVENVEVPTDKEGLLQWLNQCVAGDPDMQQGDDEEDE